MHPQIAMVQCYVNSNLLGQLDSFNARLLCMLLFLHARNVSVSHATNPGNIGRKNRLRNAQDATDQHMPWSNPTPTPTCESSRNLTPLMAGSNACTLELWP